MVVVRGRSLSSFVVEVVGGGRRSSWWSFVLVVVCRHFSSLVVVVCRRLSSFVVVCRRLSSFVVVVVCSRLRLRNDVTVIVAIVVFCGARCTLRPRVVVLLTVCRLC
mgnify:CR=1 FL=1